MKMKLFFIFSAVRVCKSCVCICLDLVEFTDEEGYGRYLDLHDCYSKYINLKGVEVGVLFLSTSCLLLWEVLWLSFVFYTLPPQKLEYITYLSSFDQLFDIPKDRKNAEYKR